MGTAADKYRIYLSGYEMQALLDLTDPENLDSSEITEPLKTARTVLRKKMAEVDEGTATIDLQVKGKKPGKYSSTGLGFTSELEDAYSNTAKKAASNKPTELTADMENDMMAKIQAAEAAANATLESGGKLPKLDNLLLDPSFNFAKD